MSLTIKLAVRSFMGKLRNSLLYRRVRVRVLNRPIRVWFFRHPEFLNFGDELTPDIISKLFKKEWMRVEIEDADLFAVGSIIELADRPMYKKSYVWGSGFIRDGEAIDNKHLIFKATRGLVSRSRLPIKYNKIPIGDPGLLSSLIYKSSVEKTNKIGIIPHYVDEDCAALEEAKQRQDEYTIISVKNPPEVVAREIAGCRFILSSSLHGLIVSDSFGIPNIHMPMSDKVVGGEYKFRDYYSAIGNEYSVFDVKDLYRSEMIQAAYDNYQPVADLQTIQNRLIKSFPY